MRESSHGKFPYSTLSPTLKRVVNFETFDDIHEEMIRVHDDAEKMDFDVGESCYKLLPFFADDSMVIDAEAQETIRVMRYSKITNTPPFPSIYEETPASFIDAVLIIDQEITRMNNHGNKK